MTSIGGVATFSGAVTLGDETADTVSISRTTTLTDDMTVVNDVYFNAEVTIGVASADLSLALLFQRRCHSERREH